MAYQLRLMLEGLCAFLPSGKIGEDQIDWVSALMVHTGQATGSALRRHHPLIQFDLRDLAGQDTAILEDIVVRWPLNEEDIFLEFENPPAAKFEIAAGLREPGQERPREENSPDADDFTWVPSLQEAFPPDEVERMTGQRIDVGDVADSCLTEHPPFVILRLHANRGRLATDRLVKVHDRISVSQFLPSEASQPLRQALASRVVLVVDDVEGKVILRMRRFRSGEWRKIELGGDGRTEPLRVHVTHLCDDMPSEEELLRDHDFEMHYRFSLPPEVADTKGLPAPATVRYHVPLSGEDRDPGGGGDFRRCGEAQLNPLDSIRRSSYEDLLERINPGWLRAAQGGRV